MSTYQNPVLANVADPDVLLFNGLYYLYPTTTDKEVGGIKVYTSRDLVHWQDRGLAMRGGDQNWGTHGFWAPDVTDFNGQFIMTYTAEEHLCIAVSDDPLGPFVQPHFGPLHPATKEIDAHVFVDDDGQAYLYFVRFTAGNVIWGAQLTPDRLGIEEDTVVELLWPSQPWEKQMGDVNEAPFVLKHEGQYLLTYSGSHFASPSYGVGLAIGEAPLGPFVKHADNPILHGTELVHGPGHHTFAWSPDGSELFILYHVHADATHANPRKMAIDRAFFAKDADGRPRLIINGPTSDPQPMPAGAPQ
ncbi:glycoside hydrolase family 43 protein [Lacticaseibacillus mingshuiensis]|uniref:Glycoside hydrolase family 43 protein n=1 Tax=Lacticaseibacillus mingshuiensis TaxID=2799574 RepID=A0ABW4CJG3_9LACO|nr:glycoside hydrolase family 43 protein [Lacticaseibacillus mingshuiensis]